jgi:hypothetical protein
MTINQTNPQNDPPCNTIAYRLILKAGWIDPDDPNKANSAAFTRRRPKTNESGEVSDPGDEDGLSVFDSIFWPDKKDCIEKNTNRCYGIITLHIGRLLDLKLKIIRDPDDRSKLLITNLPFENTDVVAERDLLEDVADSARIAFLYKHRRKN